ncbi:MAG: penicillin acylase family protein [Acidobacteriaceae bacterium]|nr:penicillin acylase family protein [Acidobacteriaceae bacterium]
MLRTRFLSFALAALCSASAQAGVAVPTSGTEILWDRYGVPHIFAPDHVSLFYAYGYAQMEAHSELLVRLYAQSRGRSAEYYGDLKSSVREGAQTYLETDRWVRENGIPERAEQWAKLQTPEFRKLLDAFAAGLNAWADKHRSEMSAEARSVLPLSTADVLAHSMRVIHYDWIVSQGKVDQMVRLGNAGEPHGSNGWAIAPSKSASGHAMLLSNSHLQWGDMHTYFEVQLHAPGVNSSGAVWVGFPALRLCFNDRLGWAQTTNAVDGADLYRLTLKDNGYVLDGQVRPFETERQTIRVRLQGGGFREEPLIIRKTIHGPVVVDRNGITAALRVTGMDRPRMLEQLWRMGLAQNLDQFQDAMRMVQLPLFNTMYADADGHILYLFNGAVPVRPIGDYKFWSGMVPGDRSDLIWNKAHSYEDLPRVVDPPSGFVQNCNDPPWTSAYPMLLDPAKFAPYIAPPPGISARAQRSIRILSSANKMTFDDLRAAKLSTHVEMADHFVDDLVALAPDSEAATILKKWDRQAEANSDGAFLFYRFLEKAGPNFRNIGGYAVPTDDHKPLTTPRGFANPAKARQALEAVDAQLQQQYGTLHVLWGDVIRLRRGSLDLPANGAPSLMGSIRTINPGPFQNGKAEAVSGDTYVALVEFSSPVHAEALLGYGNWSRAGSKHIEDQLPLMVKKVMRPSWRTRQEIEANLENKTVF